MSAAAFALALVTIGISLILLNEVMAGRQRTPDVVYKYVPRDLDTYLKDPENQPMAMYKSMFEEPPVRTF